MRLLIVGGGKVGGFLARELVGTGHAVTVIEPDPVVASRLAEETAALVVRGDGTDVAQLEHADVERTDWVLAVTGADEVNLVACELAVTLGAARTLARLNDPRNRATFDALGIPVVAVTDLMAQVISHQVELADMERIALLGRGQISLIELEIPPGSPPRRVVDLTLPAQTILVSVARDDEVVVPGADTVLETGDRILAVTKVKQEAAVQRAICEIDG